jgi:putative SOS response-associated peptidase YedK
VAEHFGLAEVPSLAPRYNIAPGQPVAVVRREPGVPGRRLELRLWGLVASAGRARPGAGLVNARAESVARLPAFRDAFRRRRCLVPADGFYEWQPRGRNPKQPYHVRPASEPLFGLAGLYESCEGVDGPLHTCTVLTTEANAAMRAVHDRMPVILPRAAWEAWLDPALADAAALLPLLRPAPADAIELHPVGLRVNDVRHDDPECARPLPGGELFPGLF